MVVGLLSGDIDLSFWDSLGTVPDGTHLVGVDWVCEAGGSFCDSGTPTAICSLPVVECPCFDASDVQGVGIDFQAQVLPDASCVDFLPDAIANVFHILV